MSEHARLPVPGLLWGDHPERRLSARGAGERARAALRALADSWRDTADTWLRPGHAAWLARFRAAEASVQSVDEQALLQLLRAELVRKGLAPEVVLQALALAARVAERCLGVRPFDSQLIAARAVLDSRLAEMATGEGKTLAVALAAATAAISGMPIHVVTANDYLVTRDASHLAPFYSALGLTVGAIVQADDPAARARAYGCNVTYVTAKELVFDYLRDRLGSSRDGAMRGRRDALAAPLVRLARSRGEARTTRLLRGLCMAIVDEADAILIDEARVPLILSLPADAEDGQASALQSLQLARALQEGTDFTLDHTLRTAELTRRGREKLEATAATLPAAWRNRLHREHAVCMALAALHLFQRERHYLVRDDGIAIIDETTGRVAAGRAWSDGLQQLIEAKEGCEPSAPLATLSQLTYQRFFPRYFRMGGVSGTLSEARFELMLSYGLSVQRIPQRRPCRRIVGPTRLFASHAELWRAVSGRVAELHRTGRPVLVATDSVAEAQALGEQLLRHGLPHAELHARNDHEEARIVAQAGQRGAITVTTNMAGRGTDIMLGPQVDERTGLHLICCQLNSARRIDRQLAGRTARQGDAGSVEVWLSLETALLARSIPDVFRPLLRRCAGALPSWSVRCLARLPQRSEERRQRGQRQRLTEQDERMERQLAFGGAEE